MNGSPEVDPDWEGCQAYALTDAKVLALSITPTACCFDTE
jgi:hypothetical protein